MHICLLQQTFSLAITTAIVLHSLLKLTMIMMIKSREK